MIAAWTVYDSEDTAMFSSFDRAAVVCWLSDHVEDVYGDDVRIRPSVTLEGAYNVVDERGNVQTTFWIA